MPTISYCITVHNEDITLNNLLSLLYSSHIKTDEIIIQDDFSNNPNTIDIIKKWKYEEGIEYYQYPLNNDYGKFKNEFIQHASRDYIFAIDGDELPSELTIGENLHALLDSNPTVEAYAVPRINDFKGVTEEHARQWGWRLDNSPTYNRPRVNFPDFQWRIFRRDYPRISFTRRLHEKIEGYSNFVRLPAEEEYALHHDKTIETQIQTNLRYNQMFSVDENRGWKQ